MITRASVHFRHFVQILSKFCLPASAYFVFLQLRSALKAYGVPWASSISSHPMRDWIAPSAGRPSVSLIYNKIIDCITKPLSIKTIWNRELSDLNLSVDWERVWSNLSLTSKKSGSSSYSLHMFWECPVVISLWTHVNLVLSSFTANWLVC